MTAFCVEGNMVVEVEYLERLWHDGLVARQKCPGPGKVVDVCLNEADARLVCDRLTRGARPATSVSYWKS
jgi:hypothetical protein